MLPFSTVWLSADQIHKRNVLVTWSSELIWFTLFLFSMEVVFKEKYQGDTFIVCILLRIYFILFLYIEVSQHNNFLILMKQNRHYCVNICFYCVVDIRYMFRPPLLGHLQALPHVNDTHIVSRSTKLHTPKDKRSHQDHKYKIIIR
jgi:hypothetical protein